MAAIFHDSTVMNSRYVSRKDEGEKVIVMERGDLLFVFNFHPTNSYESYPIGCLLPGEYKVWHILSSGTRAHSLFCMHTESFSPPDC